MDVVRMRIQYGFIQARVRMSWRDILFGLKEELLDPAVPTELARDLVNNESSDPTLIELAGLDRDEHPGQHVRALAAREHEQSPQEIRAKWLYVVLAWIFEHRDEYPDPLRAVEEVYADFDYPEQIADFVRYMPNSDPDLGSREQNEARLFEKWLSYLQECWKTYSPKRGGSEHAHGGNG